MNSVPSPEQLQIPEPLEQAVPVGGHVELNLDGAPVRTITDQDGNTRDILAFVTVPSQKDNTEPTRIAIYKPEGAGKHATTEVMVKNSDGTLQRRAVSVNKTRNTGHISPKSSLPLSTAVIKQRGKTKLVFSLSSQSEDATPTVTATEGVAKLSEGTTYEALANAKKQERNIRRRKWLVGAIGTYATLSSGGVLDHAGELQNDAKQTVESIHSVNNPNRTYRGAGDWVGYGKDSGDAPSRSSEQHETAVHNVAEVMGALDRHDTEFIATEARKFGEAHPGELLTQEQIDQYRTQLEHASTPKEAIAALDAFMQFYGKHAKLNDGTVRSDIVQPLPFDPNTYSVDDVRSLANSIIDAYSPLPAFLVRDGDFKNIVLVGGAPLGLGGQVSDKNILIPLRTRAESAVDVAGDIMPDSVAQPGGAAHAATHELGHTHDKTLEFDWAHQAPEGDTTKKSIAFIVRKAVFMNEEASDYAATSAVREMNAENFSSVFDLTSPIGLAHPDEWRRFNSGSNQRALAVLIGFEQQYPGLAAYIASQRLAKRGVLQTPLVPFIDAPRS